MTILSASTNGDSPPAIIEEPLPLRDITYVSSGWLRQFIWIFINAQYSHQQPQAPKTKIISGCIAIVNSQEATVGGMQGSQEVKSSTNTHQLLTGTRMEARIYIILMPINRTKLATRAQKMIRTKDLSTAIDDWLEGSARSGDTPIFCTNDLQMLEEPTSEYLNDSVTMPQVSSMSLYLWFMASVIYHHSIIPTSNTH